MTLQSSIINTAFKSARSRKNRKRSPPGMSQGCLPDGAARSEPAESATSAPSVYGPYADGGRWRIIAVDGEVRRALKTDTLAEAERMRDEILAEFRRHTIRTIGEALAEYARCPDPSLLTAVKRLFDPHYRPQNFGQCRFAEEKPLLRSSREMRT